MYGSSGEGGGEIKDGHQEKEKLRDPITGMKNIDAVGKMLLRRYRLDTALLRTQTCRVSCLLIMYPTLRPTSHLRPQMGRYSRAADATSNHVLLKGKMPRTQFSDTTSHLQRNH